MRILPAFDNLAAGTLEVQGGRLLLSGGSTGPGGASWAVAEGAVLEFSGGAFDLALPGQA